MGIYDQPNSWQCGPFALKHGLLAYGIFAHEDALAIAAGSTETHGTDERQLTNTARSYGCVLQLERYHSKLTARRALARLLADHTPVLLCVDQWDHWVTAVGADETHMVVFDSHYDTVVRLEPWEPFLRRLAYRHRAWAWAPQVAWYDLHPLRTRGETGVKLALTTARARQLLDGPPAFRKSLDDFARQITPFAAHNGRRSGAFPLGPWLEANRATFADAVPNDTLASLALTADLFGVRADAEGVSDLSRVLRIRDAERRGPAHATVGSTSGLAAAS
jgi:hypothetical protein